jgi:replication-associated recombination protein RarA
MWGNRTTQFLKYKNSDCVSVIQKAVRRCEPALALHYVMELHRSGNGNAAWNRLKIISSEDIGVGNSNMSVFVEDNCKKWTAMVGKVLSKSGENVAASKVIRDVVHKMCWYECSAVNILVHRKLEV